MITAIRAEVKPDVRQEAPPETDHSTYLLSVLIEAVGISATRAEVVDQLMQVADAARAEGDVLRALSLRDLVERVGSQAQPALPWEVDQ